MWKEKLNDPVVGSWKLLSTRRKPKNEQLNPILDLIPSSIAGANVEYDINYSTADYGFYYTDLLMSVIWIQPANTLAAIRGMRHAIELGPTPQGYAVLAELNQSMNDKYILDDCPIPKDLHSLILPPGSNVLKRMAVDPRKMARLPGYVKPHPLTNRMDEYRLRKLMGAERVLNKNINAYPLLRACTELHTCHSSETGIAGIILHKQVDFIDHPVHDWMPTFLTIYHALSECKSQYEALAAIFSHGCSGILYIGDADVASKLREFNDYYTADKREFGPHHSGVSRALDKAVVSDHGAGSSG